MRIHNAKYVIFVLRHLKVKKKKRTFTLYLLAIFSDRNRNNSLRREQVTDIVLVNSIILL